VLRTGSGATAWPARPVATSAATRPPAVPRMRVRTIASARTFRSLKKGLTRATPVGRHQEQGQPSGPHTGLLHDQGQQNEQVQHQREARDRRGGPRRPASASSITASQPIITAAGGVPHRGATACCPGQVRVPSWRARYQGQTGHQPGRMSWVAAPRRSQVRERPRAVTYPTRSFDRGL
jgi:hypothetical protein